MAWIQRGPRLQVLNNLDSRCSNTLPAGQDLSCWFCSWPYADFTRMVHTVIPDIQTDLETENNYRLLLDDQRTRNLFAVKLTLTHGVLRYRHELDAEMKRLIDFLQTEAKVWEQVAHLRAKHGLKPLRAP